MKEKIESLRADITAAIGQTETGRALYEVKVKFQTELKGIMSGMKDLPKEERPTFGKVVNEFKQAMEALFEERAVVVKKMATTSIYIAPFVVSSHHTILLVRRKITNLIILTS